MIKHQLITKAIEEQRRLKHPYTSTEHLLLALLNTSPTKELCESYDLTYDKFNKELEKTIGIGKEAPNKTQYTPLFERVCDYAKQTARHQQTDLEAIHFMYAILDNYEGVAIRILEALDIDIDRLCEEVYNIISTPKIDLLKEFPCLTDLNKETEKDNTVVTGLDKELTQLIKNLLRIKKPNTILIGEPGVGKTALVEKLAQSINHHQLPDKLNNLHIIQLSLGSAIAGTKYRGEFEEKIEKIITEVEKDPNIVLFIDEFHNMIGAGGAEGAIDASNLFKPALARGKIKMIGATTTSEYEEYLKRDKAFLRRFNIIEMYETTKEETISIMKDQLPKLINHYNIIVTDNELEDIYKLSTHKNGRMPDIALDTLEEYFVDKYYLDITNNSNNSDNNKSQKKSKSSNKKDKINC